MQNFSARLRNQTFVAPQDIEEFEDLQAAIAAEFAPASELEAQHVITIIHCLWSIRRTRIAECKMQERAFNDGVVDPILDVQWARQLKGVLDMRRQAERTQIQATKDFHLAAAKRQQPQPEPPPPPSPTPDKPKLRRPATATITNAHAIATTSSTNITNNIIPIDRARRNPKPPHPVPIAA